MDLEVLQEQATNCTLCELYKGRNKAVFSRGNPGSDVVICGMCPGPDENKAGVPFIGAAGSVLDDVINNAFHTTTNIYITNLVKCFVQPGTKLIEEWMVRCLPYFVAQIHFVKPKVIIGLGGDVCNFLLANDLKIGQMRGKEYDYMGAKFIPTYHPAFLARGNRKRFFDIVVKDFEITLKFI